MTDEVSIITNGKRILGWQSLAITRSAEQFPNAFTFTMTEQFSVDPNTILALPGTRCEVYIGDDLVVTGYFDRYSAATHAASHEVQIAGRGLCEDLVDCSVDLLSPTSAVINGQVSAANTLDLCKKLAAAFKIDVRSAVKDLGKPIPTFQVAAGETPWEVIERVNRYAGYLAYEDEKGALVLDRAGTVKHASGFTEGVNVEAASSTLSVDQRFSDYTVIWGTVSQAHEGAGRDVSVNRASATDEGMKTALHRYRPRITVSAQTTNDKDLGQHMADWERTRRWGRSQAVHLTCDSWRDSAGKLWQPNQLVPVHLPNHKLANAEWLISTVTYRKDLSGTHADLLLMPKEAFSVEPIALTLFDQEIQSGIDAANHPQTPNDLHAQ